MKSFKLYLEEIWLEHHISESFQEHTRIISHLDHPEDMGHIHGHAGAEHALKALHAAHDHILHGAHNSNLTTKVDGGVSIVAGHHPHTGKFFVGYKGAIKDIGGPSEAKLAYTHDDVDKHFEGKPYLQSKMHAALDHVHKVLPKRGIYQGDFLFTHDQKHEHGNKVEFTPNTITYATKRNSAEGHKIHHANMGISFHTSYHPVNGQLQSKPVEHDELKHHDDVYHLSTANDTHRANYTEDAQHQFKHHLSEAEKLNNHGGEDMHHVAHSLSPHISTYINKTVREGTTPNTEGLINHVHQQGQKELAKLKSEAGKAKKQHALSGVQDHIAHNRHHLDNYFKMHHHLQQAKNTLVSTLDNADHPLEHSINGEKAHPEGYVFHHNGVPIKLVNRQDFSKKNFEKVRD